ncbi:MAG: hypothetical protein HWD59_02300 [Coxiellaceae bacterium]|nr:MAG: hypothetical protein HWD59_02300 [Coxiellaceae bacterium]
MFLKQQISFLPSTLTNLSERLKSLPKLTIAATPNIAATANKELRNAKANMLKAVTLANSIRKNKSTQAQNHCLIFVHALLQQLSII